jgi:hypothetical protein
MSLFDHYDIHAMGTSCGDAEAEIKQLRDRIDRWRPELVAYQNDALNIRGILSPNGRPRRVPMELGAELAPVVEWLIDELEAAKPEGWESVAALHEAYTTTDGWLEDARQECKQLRAELAQAREAGEKWRRIISDLDRCPHGRHEGDTCAGWRGPGLYDGGCKDGLSLGNPLFGACAVLGIDYSSTRLIAVPEERADRVNPDAWYQPRRAEEELHHFLPGYMPEDVAAAAAAPSAVEAPAPDQTGDGMVWIATARRDVDYHAVSGDRARTVCGRATRTGLFILPEKVIEWYAARPCPRCAPPARGQTLDEASEEARDGA